MSSKREINNVPSEGNSTEPCRQCQVTGVVVLTGLSLYWNHLRMATPQSARNQRKFLGITSAGIYIFDILLF